MLRSTSSSSAERAMTMVPQMIDRRRPPGTRSSLRRLFYCDHHEIPLPAGHKFPIGKYRLVRELLAADNVFHFHFQPAAFAERRIIELVHDAEYVAHIF